MTNNKPFADMVMLPVDRYKITTTYIGDAPDRCDNDVQCQVVCRGTGQVVGKTKVRRYATAAHMEAVEIMKGLV